MGRSERTGGELSSRRRAAIRTFHPRRGRLSSRHLDAIERLWSQYGVDIPQSTEESVGLAGIFPRVAPVVLEIGSGMGDATAEMAVADPDRNYLAVDVHTPGIANLLAIVDERRLGNVRVARGDALDLVRHLPEQSLHAVHAFFPDPWPKARHHKRRLIQPAHVAVLRSRLVRCGTLHCATDWREYAESMLTTLAADPELVNCHNGFAPGPSYRPSTRYERRAVAAGRTVFDLVFRRRREERPPVIAF
jgi:tRNA (guanine-N7-)-methyltransferase